MIAFITLRRILSIPTGFIEEHRQIGEQYPPVFP
jgi:hypothetical protein